MFRQKDLVVQVMPSMCETLFYYRYVSGARSDRK